jgi:hypothetical protein
LIDARWNNLGFGVLVGLYSAHGVDTVEYRDLVPYLVALLCFNILQVLAGACGLVLKRRNARAPVYTTENGAHDPQDTGNDQ